MTTPSASSVFSKFTSSTFLNNQTNMFSSPYTKILHDPECQNQCCSSSFDESQQVIRFNDLEQYPTFTVYNSEESVSTFINNEEQFQYYDGTTCNNVVPEYTEETVGHEVVMANSELYYEKPIKRGRYTSSMNINSVDTQYKQKSYCKGVTKRKRKRTIFSTEQIIVMEGVFKKRPYVSKEERQSLSHRLNITEKAIKIWFQNRRRVTEKRERDLSDSYHSDSTAEEVCNDYNTRLDYIESRIRQNTDEYGYVTLDDKSLTELIRIIDNILSHEIDCNSLHETKSNDNYLMYEPVSPESLSDDNRESENILKWKPSKPEESLQRLIDIQTVLFS